MMLNLGNHGGFKYAPSPLLLCTVLTRDSEGDSYFVKINSNGQFPADIYWKIVAKVKTEEYEGCPALWRVCQGCVEHHM